MLRKLHPTAGSRPGTLVIPHDAQPTRLRIIQYGPNRVEDAPVEDISDLHDRVRPGCVTWIQVAGLRDIETLVEAAQQFGIHPLVFEDVVNGPQRPKSDPYDRYHLLIARALGSTDGVIAADQQVSLIVGKNFLISFQSTHDELLEPVAQRIGRPGARLRRHGPDYLAYAVLDTIVDGFYPALEQLTERLQRLEDAVLSCPAPEQLRQLSSIKRQLVRLRRVVWAQREMVATLLREDSPMFGAQVHDFLRDTHDHCVQIAEAVDMCRETVTGLVNTYLSSVGQRTNEVMKTLTIVGSIFIPLTFVAGIYGMNFSHMPELELPYAYPLAWLIMGSIALAMICYFRRKGWLGEPPLSQTLDTPVSHSQVANHQLQVVALDYDESHTSSDVPYSAAG